MATKSLLTDFDPTVANNTFLAGVGIDKTSSTADDLETLWRTTLAILAKFYDDLGGVNTVAGTATAVTVTAAEAWTAYGSSDGNIGNGTLLTLKMGVDATGAATLNVNAIGTKKIRRQGDSAIQASDWLANGIYKFRYDTAYDSAAGAWVLLNPALNAVVPLVATAADIWAGTSSAVFVAPSIMQAALVEQTLTDGATVTVDFSAGINFKLAIGGNRALAASNLTNLVGRSGYIKVTQDATGSRTLDVSGSTWKNANGQNLVLSTTANAVDYLYYQIISTTTVMLSMARAVS